MAEGGAVGEFYPCLSASPGGNAHPSPVIIRGPYTQGVVLRAYIDESGNTGFNLFDAEQPFFLNVAMSSHVDFDSVYLERVRKIADTASAPYLHASELGAEGVEAVAQSLVELVQFSQVRFYFAAVDKRDLAGMKFYDAVFDPAETQQHLTTAIFYDR